MLMPYFVMILPKFNLLPSQILTISILLNNIYLPFNISSSADFSGNGKIVINLEIIINLGT